MIRVLIVDDEFIMRQGLRYMMDWEQEGYEIVGEASNGRDALRLIGELEPHIIISDVVMPLLDGVDFSEAVHHMYPRIQMIILSGYDNFEYVKHTLLNGVVDYILKPTLNPKELKEVLKRATERIPEYRIGQNTGSVSYERMMERYLLGMDQELELSQFGNILPASYFCLYAVNVNKENDSGQNLSETLIKKIERELQGFMGIEKLMLMLREEIVCVLFGYEMSQRGNLRIKLEKLNGQLAVLCDSVFGVVSRSFTDLSEVLPVFQQDIMRYVDRGFYYQGKSLLILEGKRAAKEEEMPKFDFFRYNRLLGARQFAEALEMLGKYNTQVLACRMDVYRMKNQMKNMIFQFLDLLPMENDKKENCRYEFFKCIDQSRYQADYERAMEEIMEQLRMLFSQSVLSRDDRMDKILEYIQQNYQENLKLEDLVAEFNFNYHYLSAYFNQQMKEGFSEYLNRIRIEKACRMLEDQDIPIAEISSRVGYSEQSYFCRVFKKITGKTPSVWRREKLNE